MQKKDVEKKIRERERVIVETRRREEIEKKEAERRRRRRKTGIQTNPCVEKTYESIKTGEIDCEEQHDDIYKYFGEEINKIDPNKNIKKIHLKEINRQLAKVLKELKKQDKNRDSKSPSNIKTSVDKVFCNLRSLNTKNSKTLF